ncbi:MAG: Holliday junction resolvase RuvX [Puniceicoccales bacterium]|jgi:putative Holliday junction resolvase|nr:Holliday junction resolvase RuvX [Puniceicoccales bacterium]
MTDPQSTPETPAARRPAPVRYVGIDPGDRRVGLSHGDSETALAFPSPPAVEPDPARRMEHIAAEIRLRRADALVVGYPLNMDGSHGPRAAAVDGFISELEERFALPVHRVDEGLTSVEAEATFAPRKRGRSVRERRRHRAAGETDSRAATLILQDFLNATHPPPAEFF